MPFLHVTTRIEGRAHDGLLKEKGFGGFPSLAFLDAEGNVIAKQGARSVAGFRETLAAIRKVQDLKDRAAAGEKGLEFAILAAEWELGMMDFEQVKARLAAIPKLSDRERPLAEQMLRDAEVIALLTAAQEDRKDPAKFEAAAQRFRELLAASYAPGEHAAYGFWSLLRAWADQNEDLAIYERAVAALHRILDGDARMAEPLKQWDARLAELRKQAGVEP